MKELKGRTTWEEEEREEEEEEAWTLGTCQVNQPNERPHQKSTNLLLLGIPPPPGQALTPQGERGLGGGRAEALELLPSRPKPGASYQTWNIFLQT